MSFTITILGSGAAVPLVSRHPTAQVVQVENLMILLDCGEGTQMQLRRFIQKPLRISHIFISHLHGDHFYGLIGLINTFHLLGRKKELHLYGIAPLKHIIDFQMEQSFTTLNYPLIFHELDPEVSQVIMDEKYLSVVTLPMNHRIPTCGFLIREKPHKRKIRKEMLAKLKIPMSEFEKIKEGANFTDLEGNEILNHLITEDPVPPKSYAYCTDTAYHEPLIPLIEGCDLLYHEATFTQDKLEDAHVKFHSTAIEAATIASKANVKKLLIGHYSARYKEIDELLKEARSVFSDSYAATDGMVMQL